MINNTTVRKEGIMLFYVSYDASNGTFSAKTYHECFKEKRFDFTFDTIMDDCDKFFSHENYTLIENHYTERFNEAFETESCPEIIAVQLMNFCEDRKNDLTDSRGLLLPRQLPCLVDVKVIVSEEVNL